MEFIDYMNIGTGLLLIVVGWLCYRNPNLINPYGGMSLERKALVDIDGLKRALAIILTVAGGLMIVAAVLGAFDVIDELTSVWVLTAIALVMIIPMFIAMKKYNGFGRDRSGVLPRDSKSGKSAMWALILTALSVAFVIVLLLLSNKSPKIEVTEESISISGMYGCDIPVSEIVSVELLEKLPPVAMRTNGSSTGSYHKGHFRLKNGENCLMFIRNQAPYIELRTKDHLYYFNGESEQETLDILSKINENTTKLP